MVSSINTDIFKETFAWHTREVILETFNCGSELNFSVWYCQTLSSKHRQQSSFQKYYHKLSFGKEAKKKKNIACDNTLSNFLHDITIEDRAVTVLSLDRKSFWSLRKNHPLLQIQCERWSPYSEKNLTQINWHI